MDPDQTAPDLGPHCLPVCKNRFEKFARIFSRRHKQTTFSDVGGLAAGSFEPRLKTSFSWDFIFLFYILDTVFTLNIRTPLVFIVQFINCECV